MKHRKSVAQLCGRTDRGRPGTTRVAWSWAVTRAALSIHNGWLRAVFVGCRDGALAGVLKVVQVERKGRNNIRTLGKLVPPAILDPTEHVTDHHGW